MRASKRLSAAEEKVPVFSIGQGLILQFNGLVIAPGGARCLSLIIVRHAKGAVLVEDWRARTAEIPLRTFPSPRRILPIWARGRPCIAAAIQSRPGTAQVRGSDIHSLEFPAWGRLLQCGSVRNKQRCSALP